MTRKNENRLRPRKGPGPRRHPRQARGLMIAEAMVAIVILSLATGAVTWSITSGQAAVAYSQHNALAVQLAEDLAEEVLSRPYTSAGGTALRSTKYAISDYNNFSQAANAITDFNGTAYPAPYQTFSRSVTTSSGSLTFGGMGALTGTTITVTVTDTKGQTWTVTHFVPAP